MVRGKRGVAGAGAGAAGGVWPNRRALVHHDRMGQLLPVDLERLKDRESLARAYYDYRIFGANHKTFYEYLRRIGGTMSEAAAVRRAFRNHSQEVYGRQIL